MLRESRWALVEARSNVRPGQPCVTSVRKHVMKRVSSRVTVCTHSSIIEVSMAPRYRRKRTEHQDYKTQASSHYTSDLHTPPGLCSDKEENAEGKKVRWEAAVQDVPAAEDTDAGGEDIRVGALCKRNVYRTLTFSIRKVCLAATCQRCVVASACGLHLDCHLGTKSVVLITTQLNASFL